MEFSHFSILNAALGPDAGCWGTFPGSEKTREEAAVPQRKASFSAEGPLTATETEALKKIKYAAFKRGFVNDPGIVKAGLTILAWFFGSGASVAHSGVHLVGMFGFALAAALSIWALFGILDGLREARVAGKHWSAFFKNHPETRSLQKLQQDHPDIACSLLRIV
ncbi:MAG: hypothetical protein HYU64_09450 [Armatimonadetes bacterium]|nr:hypothetical protein [Armatimonadota bacterium]